MRLYTDGTWSIIGSSLDNLPTDHELYQRLQELGFVTYQELVYRAGVARLYIREHIFTKKATPLAFDFCCILYLGEYTRGSFLYPVALKTLQDVIRFLQEIDAHVSQTQAIEMTNLGQLQESLTDLADRLENPSILLRHFQMLKMTLDQLLGTLNTLVANMNQGVPFQLVQAPSSRNSQASISSGKQKKTSINQAASPDLDRNESVP
jgi:hypothetical protein